MSNQEYGEYAKKRNPSSTWNYFLTSRDRQSAKCKMCSRIIKTAGASTSGLHGHLRSRHKITLDYINKQSEPKPARPKAKRSKANRNKSFIVVKQEPVPADVTYEVVLQNEFNDNEPLVKTTKLDDAKSLVLISRMAVLDGIPINSFCTSIDLRQLFAHTGYDLPTTEGEVIDIILMHRDIVKADLKQRLNALKLAGNKFCLTFEQFYLNNYKSYVSVNIHNKNPEFSQSENLGLLKVKHCNPLDEFLKAVSDCLLEYDMSFNEDIIAFSCTSSVMVGDGRSLGNNQQLCLAQTIQDAVIKVLYGDDTDAVAKSNSLNTDESDEDVEELNKSFLITKPCISSIPHLFYNDLVEKVRKIVKYFKNSTTRSDLLQTFVCKKYEKEMHLILDCKYKWSTVCDMIGRFLKLKDFVQQVLQFLEMDTFITESELRLLTEIHDSLVVVKATVAALCKPSANLLTADAALKFMLRKLDEQNNAVSTNFVTLLRKLIGERRTVISSVLQYLHDRYTYNNQEVDETFKKPPFNDIVDVIVAMLERLRHQKPNQADTRKKFKIFLEQLRFDDPLKSDDEESIEKQLENEINSSCNDKLPKSSVEPRPDLERIVMGEISIYESAGGNRGMYLSTAYEHLLCIAPATAEAEQFYYATPHAYKGISCSSGKALSALFFLRQHFMVHSERCFL